MYPERVISVLSTDFLHFVPANCIIILKIYIQEYSLSWLIAQFTITLNEDIILRTSLDGEVGKRNVSIMAISVVGLT